MGVPFKRSATSGLRVWTMHLYVMTVMDVFGSPVIPKYNEK